MKKFKRILSMVLVALTLMSTTALFVSADDNVVEISEAWKVMGAKYSSATRTVLKLSDRITTKFQGFEFTRGENGSIEVDIPDYEVFKGIIPVAAVSSTATTPLDNLEVTMSPADESAATIFKTNAILYSGYYNVLWTVDPIDYIAGESAESGATGVGHADGAQYDGLRDIVADGALGMGVYVTNNYSAYSGTTLASTVAVLSFDGLFNDTYDGYGMRWWFRARNYTDHSSWGDSSGIRHTYEAIETSEGLTIKVRPDDTLGYVVVINGKDYCEGDDVAYFPNNTKIVEVDGGQNEYTELAESYVTSMTYARRDIDFSNLVGEEDGYLTVGFVGGDITDGTDLYNFSIDTINGIPADDWNGEPNEHEHVGEWIRVSESTCAIPGVEIFSCTECGAVIKQKNDELLAEHVLQEEWTTLYNATATSEGVQTKNCIYHPTLTLERRTNPFADVAFGKWYTEGILYCYQNGYMSGTAATEFSYKATMDRQMFATILAKIDGADLSEYTTMTFSDVKSGQWYSAAIEWAYKNSYASGVGDDSNGNPVYGRKNPVTREQLALFFYTYAEKNGVDVSDSTDLSKYEDFDRVHDWALPAMKWAVSSGLISGTSDTTLSPRSSGTRAEVSLIVMNFVENVLEPSLGCTVTFDAVGGICDTTSISVPCGTAIGTLPTTTYEGLRFDGWCYLNKIGILARVDENTVIEDSMTLTASWRLGNIVTLDADGGYCSEDYRFVVPGEALGRLPVPCKKGYIFTGWTYNDSKVTADTIINSDTDYTIKATYIPTPANAEVTVDPDIVI